MKPGTSEGNTAARPAPEQHDRAGEEIGRTRAGKDALHQRPAKIFDEPQRDHALEAEERASGSEARPATTTLVTATARVGAMRHSRSKRPEHREQQAGGDEGEIADQAVGADGGERLGADHGEPGDDDGGADRACAGSFSFEHHASRAASPPSAAQEGWITPPWASGTNRKPA